VGARAPAYDGEYYTPSPFRDISCVINKNETYIVMLQRDTRTSKKHMFSAHLTAVFLHVNQLIKCGNTPGLHALTP